MGNLFTSRKAAKTAGAKRYTTGIECPAGHNAERFTSNGRCCECSRLSFNAQRIEQPEIVRAREARARVRNNLAISTRRREYYRKNAETEKASAVEWQAANKEKVRAYDSRRRAAKDLRVPKWFGEFDAFVVTEAHHLSLLRRERTGIDWQVDHMIPLLAKRASGLYCAHNLQVIPAQLNARKTNRLWLTQPCEWLQHI